MALLDRVAHAASRHAMWRPETRVVAAVSGGSDSVALLLVLQALHDRGELVLECVAHLNHGIRGRDADDDEAFCRELASDLGVAFVAERIDVPAIARRDRLSLEVAGRNARRSFLDGVRQSRGANRIATAHTADDQAETVLLRITRGAGIRGLGAIAPVRGVWIRPLIEITRAKLREELGRRSQGWREDATNDDVSNPRNRVRHELIPLLEQHFNPAVRQALGRLADAARADEAALDDLASAAAQTMTVAEGGIARIETAALNALPLAVARRVVRLTVQRLAAEANPGLRAVDRVLAVADGRLGASRICSLEVEPSGGFVVLVTRRSAGAAPAAFRFDLSIPGEIHLPTAGWTVQAEGPIKRRAGNVGPGASDEVVLDADELGSELVVRSRQPGDRLRPLGVGGRKKVQDVLVDRKVPRDERDFVPIVTDRQGRIVWVAGHVLAEEFRVSGGTNAVVILKLRRA